MKVVILYTTNLAAEEEPTGLLLAFSAVDAVAASVSLLQSWDVQSFARKIEKVSSSLRLLS